MAFARQVLRKDSSPHQEERRRRKRAAQAGEISTVGGRLQRVDYRLIQRELGQAQLTREDQRPQVHAQRQRLVSKKGVPMKAGSSASRRR